MRDTFLGHGKLWNDRIRGEIKTLVAETVVGTPTTALSEHKRGSFDGLVTALQQRLAALHT
jgi:hypothetical protein